MELSILIPSYCGAARLGRLFASMPAASVASERDGHEVLVYDDGSPLADFAATSRAAWGAQGVRPRVLCGGENLGWPAGVKALTAAASGRVILLLDDDVLLPTGFVQTVRAIFAALPSIGAVSWRSEGKRPGQSSTPRVGLLEPATQIAGYCMAFRRDVYEEVGGIDTRFKFYCSDSDLALRMTLAGHPSYRAWWPLVPHEEHGAWRGSPEAEVRRQALAAADLVAFREKWGADGAEMERRALAKLVET